MFYVYCLYSVNTDVVWGYTKLKQKRKTRIHIQYNHTLLHANGIVFISTCSNLECLLHHLQLTYIQDSISFHTYFKVKTKRISFTISPQSTSILCVSILFDHRLGCWILWWQNFLYMKCARSRSFSYSQLISACVYYTLKYFAFSISQLYDGIPVSGIFMYSIHDANNKLNSRHLFAFAVKCLKKSRRKVYDSWLMTRHFCLFTQSKL